MKKCVGFPKYLVSEDGKIFTLRGGKLTRRKTAIITRQRATYEQITLFRDGKYVTKNVHRLVLEAYRGPCPPGHESRHLNGQSTDNRLDNLVWGTRKENSDDKHRHGTMPVGERNGSAKLREVHIEAIRVGRDCGYTIQQLADDFGVSRSQIKRILAGRSWGINPLL